MPKEDSFHSQRTDRPASHAESRMFKFFAQAPGTSHRGHMSGLLAGHVMNDEASQQRYQPSATDPAGEMAEAAMRLNRTRLARQQPICNNFPSIGYWLSQPVATTCRLRPQPSSHYTPFRHPSGLEAWLSLKGPTSVPQAHDSTPWPGEMPHTPLPSGAILILA